jgi:MscS family membrane protein
MTHEFDHKMAILKRHLFLFSVSFTLCTNLAVAQQTNQFKAADTSSPRDTLRSFIDACNELHDLIQTTKCIDRTTADHRELALRVLDCLDAGELPPFARQQAAGEAAAVLKEILDRVELPPWEKIPDAEAIQAAGGFEKLSRWRIPDTRITIERVEEGPQKHEYLFSTGTVDRALVYYQDVAPRPYRTDGPKTSPGFYDWYISAPGSPGLGAIVAKLPRWMRFGRTLGLANWKWPGVIVLVAIAITLMWVLYRLYFTISNRVIHQSVLKYWLTAAFPVGAMLVPLVFEYLMVNYLTVRSTPLYITSFCSDLATVLAAVVVIFAVSNRTAEAIIASPQINPAGLNAQLIRIASKLLSLVATVTILIAGGHYLGIPIATLLASAGIGGLALALGAQDTLKTLFATITIMADKPCRAGDRIIVGEFDGFVEDIGLRSTKLRLLSGPLVTIPNDQLASRDVENVSARQNIRRSAEVHIPLDTPCEQVERAVAIIREKLAHRDEMDPDFPPRVFFDEFGPEVFRIRFIYWYTPPDYWEFKEFGDKLNFDIFRAFEAEGIQFSLPFRHTYWKHDDEQGPLEIEITNGERMLGSRVGAS